MAPDFLIKFISSYVADVPHFLHRFIFYGEVVGAAATIGGAIYTGFVWFRTINETNKTVELLASNHLPHIQTTLSNQDVALAGLKSDVHQVREDVSTVSKRLDDHLNFSMEIRMNGTEKKSKKSKR